MRKTMGKRESIVIALVVVVCVVGWLFWSQDGGSDQIAQIIHEGKVVYTINLSKHTGEDVYHIDASQPVTIKVKDDTIGFWDSQCPDHLCERTGSISRPTQTAVCLPLKTAVVIKSGEDKDVDGIAR